MMPALAMLQNTILLVPAALVLLTYGLGDYIGKKVTRK
jgi:hypothetical protein